MDIEKSQGLGAMVGTVIDYMEEHLPYDEILVSSLERLVCQVFIPQIAQVVPHFLLNAVLVGMDALAFHELRRFERSRDFGAA